jgi:hypothetical protein
MEKFNCNRNEENTADHLGVRTQDPCTSSQMPYQLSYLANEYESWMTAT